ncbi:hypothetical protein D3C80_1838330 [compost metagenome]
MKSDKDVTTSFPDASPSVSFNALIAALTAFGVAATVSDTLSVALLSWTMPFCFVVAS